MGWSKHENSLDQMFLITATAHSHISPDTTPTSLFSPPASRMTVIDPTPPDIRRVLAGSHNTIALLLLLFLHYVMANIIPIMGLLSGTILLIHLDQRLRLHADVQVPSSVTQP